jgi:hypothetical protein
MGARSEVDANLRSGTVSLVCVGHTRSPRVCGFDSSQPESSSDRGNVSLEALASLRGSTVIRTKEETLMPAAHRAGRDALVGYVGRCSADRTGQARARISCEAEATENPANAG